MTVEQQPEETTATQYPTLLSRYAAIKGHAVATHRFEYVQHSLDGIEVAALNFTDQLIELWRARFPDMSAKSLDLDHAKPDDFPLLYVNAEGDGYIVRGRVGGNRVSLENAEGAASEANTSELSNGAVLQLDTGLSDSAALGTNKSASDYFAAAIRAHRGIFAEAILATLVISLIGLGSAMYTMQVYDRVVPTKGYSTLFVLSVGVAIAIILELLMKLVRARMVDRACKAIDQDLSSIFFGKALDIRLDARPKTVGTFASQIRHFESVRNFMTSSTLFIYADAPFALFFIGVIWFIGGQVALVPLILVPLSILIGLAFRKPIESYTAEAMDESNRKNGLLIEAIDGVESVKSVNAEWKIMDRWRELTATIANSELKLRFLTTLSSNLTQTMQQFSYVGIVAVGAYLITQGEMTMGALIACSIIGGRALAPLAQIPNLIVQWKQAKIALDVLNNIMELPGEREPDRRLIVPESCFGAIKTESLAFAYSENVTAVQLDKLDIKAGERVAILGAIGSGKSSLVKLLAGIYQPSSGRVFLDGVDFTHLSPEFVRHHIAYLPQDVRLFNGTLRDNLTLGLSAPSDEQILSACRLTGLDKVIESHPLGLSLVISEGGLGLSGGQRQLVGVTRMLLAKPRLLFLDEPTASMDSQSEATVVRHLFEEISRDTTIVVVTHKVALLPYVDRVIVMDSGRIVMDGARDNVLATLQSSAAKAKQSIEKS